MQRLMFATQGAYEITVSTVNDEGQIVTPVAPFSVTVYDGAGAQVDAGTPTYSHGVLTYQIPASAVPHLDALRAVWDASDDNGGALRWFSDAEIVGGFMFEIADLRDQDRTFTLDKYPSPVLREVRSWVEDVIEGPRAANVAFVPRSARITIDGSGTHTLPLPNLDVREVYAVTVNGTAWTEAELAQITPADGLLFLEWGKIWPGGKRNITLHYSHGLDRPPGAITRAGLMLAREYLVKSDVPGRATATSIGDQLFRLTIAGRDGVTGIPDVDAAIDQFGRKTYTVG